MHLKQVNLSKILKKLYEELSTLDITEYDIIYLSRDSDRCVYLSHDNKERFFAALEDTDCENTGILAGTLIKK